MEQKNKEGNFHGDNAERQRRHSETNELKTKGRQSEYEGHPPFKADTASWPRLRWTHQQLHQKELLLKAQRISAVRSPCLSRLGVPSAFSFAHGAALSTAHTNLSTAHGGRKNVSVRNRVFKIDSKMIQNGSSSADS